MVHFKRAALDSAQAAKGAVVQVLHEMTAWERGNKPHGMATDNRRPTEGASTSASSAGPRIMYPVSKKAACKQAQAREDRAQDEPVGNREGAEAEQDMMQTMDTEDANTDQ